VREAVLSQNVLQSLAKTLPQLFLADMADAYSYGAISGKYKDIQEALKNARFGLKKIGEPEPKDIEGLLRGDRTPKDYLDVFVLAAGTDSAAFLTLRNSLKDNPPVSMSANLAGEIKPNGKGDPAKGFISLHDDFMKLCISPHSYNRVATDKPTPIAADQYYVDDKKNLETIIGIGDTDHAYWKRGGRASKNVEESAKTNDSDNYWNTYTTPYYIIRAEENYKEGNYSTVVGVRPRMKGDRITRFYPLYQSTKCLAMLEWALYEEDKSSTDQPTFNLTKSFLNRKFFLAPVDEEVLLSGNYSLPTVNKAFLGTMPTGPNKKLPSERQTNKDENKTGNKNGDWKHTISGIESLTFEDWITKSNTTPTEETGLHLLTTNASNIFTDPSPKKSTISGESYLRPTNIVAKQAASAAAIKDRTGSATVGVGPEM